MEEVLFQVTATSRKQPSPDFIGSAGSFGVTFVIIHSLNVENNFDSPSENSDMEEWEHMGW